MHLKKNNKADLKTEEIAIKINKKLRAAVLKLIDEVMEKESPGWDKKKAGILKHKGSLMDALEVDSLLALEIVSRVEKRFALKLKEEDFVYFDNIENIVNLIERKLKIKEPKTQKIGAKNANPRRK